MGVRLGLPCKIQERKRKGRFTHGVQSNSQRATLLGLFGLTGMVDDGLMVLHWVSWPLRNDSNL